MPVTTPTGTYNVDIVVPDVRLALEADDKGHDRPNPKIVDPARNDAMQHDRWTLLRFDKYDTKHRPTMVEAAIASAISRSNR
jgi:very-short-patch-repair endonuclease